MFCRFLYGVHATGDTVAVGQNTEIGSRNVEFGIKKEEVEKKLKGKKILTTEDLLAFQGKE